ncbi:hypothetical protein M378DRAFT_924196 [Amanita muscaria Koide BX008]|uniref:Uncharacterized protein n=1 Tax=Amanita muscaria (strain Koide BX008) TaxID=946122 RepID=A0A0C2XF50_AMAMK|nr:hypothetical protein M378DRAFT_924196 [Amanita muscaria Koide BX008]
MGFIYTCSCKSFICIVHMVDIRVLQEYMQTKRSLDRMVPYLLGAQRSYSSLSAGSKQVKRVGSVRNKGRRAGVTKGVAKPDVRLPLYSLSGCSVDSE